MVRMTILASGSRGNAAVVTGGRTRVLVDAGVSCREILRRMAAAGEDWESLDAILISHEHADHVQGLPVLARRLGVPVYFTEATHRAWIRSLRPQKRMSYGEWLQARRAETSARAGVEGSRVEAQGSKVEAQAPRAKGGEARAFGEPMLGRRLGVDASESPGAAGALGSESGRISAVSEEPPESAMPEDAGQAAAEEPAKSEPWALPAVEHFQAGKMFSVGDLEITAFTIPHDAADPVGFMLASEGVRIGMATDLGYMPANACEQLRSADVVMLESNHDLDMLRDGPYPWSVKQRVLSRVGHLSNAAAAEFLEKRYDGGAAYVVLAHLSESNNLPELAQKAAEWALRDRMSLLGNRLVVARQDVPTESILL